MTLLLSTNLGQITEEIIFFKQQAGTSMFEIGRRIKHVKENDLAHGEYMQWLERVEVDHSTAKRLIQAVEQFGNGATSHHLSTSKIFEMLSLPESIDRQDFIEKPHTIPSSGETKTVDEMTVKELREVKKELQEAELRAVKAEKKVETIIAVTQQLEGDLKHTKSLLDRELNRPIPQPQVVTQNPPDYEEAIHHSRELNNENVRLHRALTDQRQTYEEKLTQQQKQDASKRDLQKYLSEHLRAMTMNHDSAVFNYTAIQGDREAYDIVMRFLHQYETIIKNQFDEWKQLTSIRAVN